MLGESTSRLKNIAGSAMAMASSISTLRPAECLVRNLVTDFFALSTWPLDRPRHRMTYTVPEAEILRGDLGRQHENGVDWSSEPVRLAKLKP
jgi:hypothetical protein